MPRTPKPAKYPVGSVVTTTGKVHLRNTGTVKTLTLLPGTPWTVAEIYEDGAVSRRRYTLVVLDLWRIKRRESRIRPLNQESQ